MKALPQVKKFEISDRPAGRDYVETQNPDLPAEGYEILSDEKGAELRYGDEAGLFYGRITFDMIKKEYGFLPIMKISDSPAYPFRAYHFDCCRHFFTVDEVKKIADIASKLKLNRFHWHLTDDQGWRAEIKKYPRLTEIGSKRVGTLGDGKPVEGYYTREEMAEVVEYCRARHITVVPEIDMPGHFTAAIAAYPELGCTGEKTEVAQGFGIFRNVACAGKSAVREFLKDVLREIMEIFPSEYIHIGGDEALKINWRKCPDCTRAVEERDITFEELQGELLTEMVAFLNENGRKAIIWNDGLYGGNVKGDYAVQYWKTSKAGNKTMLSEAKKGAGIIYSPCMRCYLDYPHGLTSMRKSYSCGIPEELKNVALGIEGTMWAEYVPDNESAEKHYFPRLFAIADRAWGGNDYGAFKKNRKFLSEYLHADIDFAEERRPDPIFGRLAQVLKFVNNMNNKYNYPQARDMKRDMSERKKSPRG